MKEHIRKSLILQILLIIFSLSILVNISNLIAINLFDKENFETSLVKVILFTFPINLVASFGFNYYYGKKIEHIPYAILNILFISLNILISVIIQSIYFKTPFILENYIGITIIIIGVFLINNKKKAKKLEN